VTRCGSMVVVLRYYGLSLQFRITSRARMNRAGFGGDTPVAGASLEALSIEYDVTGSPDELSPIGASRRFARSA
jgi:hypothetical protein